ncbi:hypothetical protein D3093_14955 (plasmid) [Azospirillum argentinense]|uniref:Uncharacterized protein n=1 Tax=Azospirillum argentinense TaxID=2970906 RepID=A0A4D8PH91_9PROT|nr:hypothetical protein [Azospirillum argentinense]QCN96640.1 hypothetical protein D3093_14955 [Azospirillum argentinense]
MSAKDEIAALIAFNAQLARLLVANGHAKPEEIEAALDTAWHLLPDSTRPASEQTIDRLREAINGNFIA